jgi:hypothetical protein
MSISILRINTTAYVLSRFKIYQQCKPRRYKIKITTKSGGVLPTLRTCTVCADYKLSLDTYCLYNTSVCVESGAMARRFPFSPGGVSWRWVGQPDRYFKFEIHDPKETRKIYQNAWPTINQQSTINNQQSTHQPLRSVRTVQGKTQYSRTLVYLLPCRLFERQRHFITVWCYQLQQRYC